MSAETLHRAALMRERANAAGLDASWSPAVETAVADLLNQIVNDAPLLTAQVKDAALAVANVYLGEPA